MEPQSCLLFNLQNNHIETLRKGPLSGLLFAETSKQDDIVWTLAQARENQRKRLIRNNTEVEKALSGVGSGGETDGGTGDRMFGRLLEWQQDHKSDVFMACTCNNIEQIMKTNPEFCRAERFDAMFFFDMPGDQERQTIWELYLKMYGIPYKAADLAKYVSRSESWTGAEIRGCCRLSAMLQDAVMTQMDLTVPVTSLADNTLTSLRKWADRRCRSAAASGLYVYTDSTEKKRERSRLPAAQLGRRVR